MALRDALRKAAGLLVEIAPEESSTSTEAGGVEDFISGLENDPGVEMDSFPVPAARTVDEIVREAEGPNLDQIDVPASGPPVMAADGEVDTAAIYQAANLPAVAFGAEQMLEMLASLPAELPLDTRRQTVKVTLGSLGKTVGATADSIVADASRKIAALTVYVENLSNQTNELATQVEKEVAVLQAQIEEKRKTAQDARFKLTQVTDRCSVEANRLDDVLEFFSLDVPPSKYTNAEPASTNPAS